MTFEEFALKTKRAGSHKFKITGSYGVKSAFREMRKNKWKGCIRPVNEKEFYTIINNVNKCYAEALLNGEDITLPDKMGRISLAVQERKVKLVDGKVKCTKPIDWKETLKLWYEDEESRNNKTLVRRDVDKVFMIRFNSHYGTTKNKQFFKFMPCRSLKLKLKDKIINNEITDAFNYGKVY